MQVHVYEATIALSELKPGQMAISLDRKKVWACGYKFNTVKKENETVLLNLNKLSDQYSDNWDLSERVKLLGLGDCFKVTI